MARFWKSRIAKMVYIFCEWETEEKYFKKLNSIFRTGIKTKIIDLKWWTEIQKHPEAIKRLIKWRLAHDNPHLWWIQVEVFVVFDLDIFSATEINNTIRELKDYNVMVTNEVFEYWILSHFEKYNLPWWKNKYLWKIKSYISIKNDKFTWNTDYQWLKKENIELAIQHVKDVNVSHWNLKSRDPYSEVYKIIEFLEN
jgi:hypothetical protein